MGRHRRKVGSCVQMSNSELRARESCDILYELIDRFEPDIYMLNKMTWDYKNIYFLRNKVNKLMFVGSVTTSFDMEKNCTVYKTTSKDS